MHARSFFAIFFILKTTYNPPSRKVSIALMRLSHKQFDDIIREKRVNEKKNRHGACLDGGVNGVKGDTFYLQHPNMRVKGVEVNILLPNFFYLFLGIK